MSYTNLEIRNFQGLYLQQNSFEVPDGAMEIASRVVIKSDQVITKMNGLYEYWRPDGIMDLDDIKATYTFQGQLLGFFANGVGHFTESFPFGGTFNALGTLTENDSERSVSFESGMDFMSISKNLYFTANEGVYKLEAYNAKVRKAGVPPALGIRNWLKYSASGVLEGGDEGSQTGFRALFGRRDLNGNLLLSAPSDVMTVGVPGPIPALAYTVTGGVATVTYGDEYLIAPGDTFTVDAATNPDLDGIQTNTSPILDGVLTFSTFAANGSGTLTLILAIEPQLSIDIPSEITDVNDQYFVQLYRSSTSLSASSAPFPDFRLTQEKTLTASEIFNGVVELIDTVDSLLLGAELYTNPNTREGELQENSRPPLAKYISPFKNCAAFANVLTVQRAALDLVNPDMLTGIDLVFKSGVNEETYRAVNVSNYSPGNVYPRTTSAAVLTINYGSHSFPLGSIVRLSGITGTVAPGDYPLTAVGASTMTISTTGTMTAVTVQVISDGTAFLYNGYSSTDSLGILIIQPLAEWTELVARDLCRAINSNRDSFMYANYRSQFDDFPGKIGIQSKDFIDPIYVRYSAAPTSPAFIQNIPSSFLTGIQFYSENDVLPNVVHLSKIGEPEAVPVVNSFPVGSVNSEIVGIFALKDSLIVLKEDGVYKIVGDVISQMTSVPIDLTIQFSGEITQAASIINNTVIAFCNQGVVQITETTVQIISRRIEDVIQPLIGRDLSTTFLFGHEGDRLFYVQTSGLNPGEADVAWVFNVINQTWTSTPDVFTQLSLGSKNELVGIRLDADLDKNVIWKQRKTNTRVDYCGAYVIGDIVVDASDLTSGTFTITGGNIAVPAVGDVILSQNIFNRIIAVTPSGGDYVLTFAQSTAIAPTTPLEVTLYKAYESIVKMAPCHAGQVGRSKHFAQMQIHLRQQVITNLSIDFAGAFYGSSELTMWKPFNLSTQGAQGWGSSPWGLFPWGLVDGSNIVAGTEPASIIRTLVPRFAARNTFIQAVLKHTQASQPMFIQALSYSIHGYGERTSK